MAKSNTIFATSEETRGSKLNVFSLYENKGAFLPFMLLALKKGYIHSHS